MTIKIEPPLTKEKLEQAIVLAKKQGQKSQKKSALKKLFGKGSHKKINPMKLQKKMRVEWG
jgi:hypothetical protein